MVRKTLAGTFVVGLLLAAGTLLLLLVGPHQAQGQDPVGRIPGGSGGQVAATVSARIPIQGRLTDEAGKPLNGAYQIRFRLYDTASGSTVLCEDTNLVSVEQGLFDTDIYGCSTSDLDGKLLYLGVRVESDAEMTPRRPIYPVPYAWSLRPGAQMSATLTSNAMLHVENHSPSGRGLRAYAMAETGTNYGVVGATRSADGYGGYFYNNNPDSGEGAGLRAWSQDGNGVEGVGGTDVEDTGGWFKGDVGVYGEGVIGVQGESDLATAVSGHSGNHYGVLAWTDRSDQNYGLYTTDNCRAADYHTGGALMQIVQNGGQESLEPGDVAAFCGLVAPLGEEGSPVIQVAKATTSSSTAVAGVVHSWYNAAVARGKPEQLVRGGQEVTREGPVAPGEYLLLVVRGPARVKASALGGAIQPGDLLSSASQPGRAARAVSRSIEGVSVVPPGTVLGKALQPLDRGEALVYIYVTLD